jgi:hypothetical protein
VLSARHKVLRILFAAGLVAAGTSAEACSVRKVLTPKQLVAGADAIVRVRVLGATGGPESLRANARLGRSHGPVPMMELEALEVVRGTVRAGMLRVVGVGVDHDDWNDQSAPYDFVRPAGRKGMCYATEYRPGAEYLLFFHDGSTYWSPLAPTNEQVHGADDAWLGWVRREVALERQ